MSQDNNFRCVGVRTPRRKREDVPFEALNLHRPEPGVAGLRIDVSQFPPPPDELGETFIPVAVSFTGLELISGDQQRRIELIDDGMSFRVGRCGRGRLDYSKEVNGRIAAMALRASFMPPTIEFLAAIIQQPAELGKFEVHKVKGYIHYSLFENDDD